jgi:hypothetical protein
VRRSASFLERKACLEKENEAGNEALFRYVCRKSPGTVEEKEKGYNAPVSGWGTSSLLRDSKSLLLLAASAFAAIDACIGCVRWDRIEDFWCLEVVCGAALEIEAAGVGIELRSCRGRWLWFWGTWARSRDGGMC